MKTKPILKILVSVFLVTFISTNSGAIEPVTPNASKEAKALLDLFYRVSGKYTFTGQHNYPATDRFTNVHKLTNLIWVLQKMATPIRTLHAPTL